jgi:ectoine hydroxylase-related dioxygenase (phytanoyl-CoA dioxygenase family)
VQPDRDIALKAIAEDGYVVLHDVAPMATFDAIEARLAELFDGAPQGRNDFEGFHTVRLGNLIAKGEAFHPVATNDDVLGVVEGVLGPHFQVSIMQAIHILPGENAQGLHTDDGLFPLPVPHPPVVCNTMWAITDFTEANGATRLIPKSHLLEAPPPPDAEEIAAEMPRGSVLCWLGNLWHQGGANTTDTPRTGITMNYNQSWLRQQENQYLGIPFEMAQGFDDRLRRLVGYEMHPPFIGNVDGRHPIKLLDE